MDISHILTAEHRAAGLWLKEEEDIVTLGMGDKVIAKFSVHAEIANIRYCADQALNWSKSGITFEKGSE